MYLYLIDNYLSFTEVVIDMNTLSWSQLNPVVTYANQLACEPGFSFGPRIIYNYQFIFVNKGKGKGRIQNRAYVAQKGDLFFYSPYVEHYFEADISEPFELYGMHFALEGELPASGVRTPQVSLTADLTQFSQVDNTLIIKGEADFIVPEYAQPSNLEIKRLFGLIIQEYNKGAATASLLNKAYLIELLIHMENWHQHIEAKASQTNEAILNIKRLLEEQAALPYDRQWLREASKYHEDHAARLFQKQEGMSPHHYHLLQKMNMAKKLLAYSDLSVTDITEQLHFGSVHYFSRCFKHNSGFTPTDFRKMKRMI
jgi:AraC-like DNA-binding protein